MVTRNIKANTATQVNANLIGVLVHPNTNPPIVTVDDIVVDYKYEVANVVSSLPVEDWQSYSKAVELNSGGVYYWTGDGFEVDGVNYLVIKKYEDGEVSFPDRLYTSGFTISSNVYSYDSETTQLTQVSNIKSVFETNCNFIRTDQDNYINTNVSGLYSVIGDYMCDTNTFKKIGFVTGSTVNTDSDVTFVKGSTSGDYQTWTNDNYISEGFGTRSLYTTTDSPAVGDSALFTNNSGEEDYNVQTIKAIDTTETPVDPDPVDCKLSYSVDGSTWTDWPENITDDNNVISNIPRYMYLKFSQDVVITVE